MEILKEIMNKSKNTVINEEYVIIGGKEVDKKNKIEIGDQSGKFYTLEQLAFFILNKDIMYTQYLKKCKEQNISPIFYTDQKLITEELKKVREDVTVCRYDLPDEIYFSRHDYSWVSKLFSEKNKNVSFKTSLEPYRIVVPSSLISFINLSNIEEILISGNVIKNSKLVLDKLKTNFNGKKFLIEDTIDDWTSEDWKSLVGIFVDGSSFQINEWKIGDIAGLFSKIPVFYLYEEGNESTEALDGYKINRIKVDKGTIKKEDLDKIWRLIMGVCESNGNGL
ncbi:hypothetical protein NBO_94g0003 [Nosema bombycis CQ1]|uniref:Cell division control protein 73 C-terminal domain-containing protein n=1 Tax=Nosema bombycis (strain CQ1 / CVCC 102059) TaxID=578461 RepID=R0KR79_NOSB1|nr:hypothetical protein NBO_94g0003 [Nosema bombycis CQ1]|eukprot:EOB13246.1 hypothetical protein NBO_94g0003 [Nosema bombycis CQ1]